MRALSRGPHVTHHASHPRAHGTLEQDGRLSQPGSQPLEVLDAPLEAIVTSIFNKVTARTVRSVSALAQVADGAAVKAAGVEGGRAQDMGRARLGVSKKACGCALCTRRAAIALGPVEPKFCAVTGRARSESPSGARRLVRTFSASSSPSGREPTSPAPSSQPHAASY